MDKILLSKEKAAIAMHDKELYNRYWEASLLPKAIARMIDSIEDGTEDKINFRRSTLAAIEERLPDQYREWVDNRRLKMDEEVARRLQEQDQEPGNEGSDQDHQPQHSDDNDTVGTKRSAPRRGRRRSRSRSRSPKPPGKNRPTPPAVTAMTGLTGPRKHRHGGGPPGGPPGITRGPLTGGRRRRASSSSSSGAEFILKPPKIETFKGTRGREAREFMSKCELYCTFQNSRAMVKGKRPLLDRQKCMYTLMLCTEEAYNWARPYIFAANAVVPGDDYFEYGQILDAWEKFKKRFLRQFSALDEDRLAEGEISRLTAVGKSVADYANKFRDLATRINWNDEAKIAAFRKGLPMGVKEVMSSSIKVPTGFEQFVNWVVRIGKQKEELRKESRNNASNTSGQKFNNRGNFNNFRGGGRRNWNNRGNFNRNNSAAGSSNPSGENNNKGGDSANWRNNRLTPQQINEYRRAGKCFKCGKTGHISNDPKFHPQGGNQGQNQSGNVTRTEKVEEDKESEEEEERDPPKYNISGTKKLKNFQTFNSEDKSYYRTQ